MFFGQEVKTSQTKSSAMTMETDVKLSQAVLDPATKQGNKKEPVCLMAEIQGKSFMLAVLDPSQSWQCPLDLMLAAGTEVKFYLRGQGTIHLTGYEFHEDDAEDFDLSMTSDDDEESPAEVEPKHAAKKIKVKNSPAATNGVKQRASKLAAMKASGDDNQMDDSDDDDSEDLSFGSDDVDDEDGDVDSSEMDDVDLDGLSDDDNVDDEDGQDDDDDVDEEDDDDDDESD